MNTIAKVDMKKALEKRTDFLNVSLENVGDIEKVHISLGNSKMGKIPSFSVLPLVTCANFGKCGRYCYACKGCFNFNANIYGLAENTALLMTDPARVEKEINDFLDCTTVFYKYFRWNVSGDVFSDEYLQVIVNVAIKNPMTKFLLFTKQYDRFNSAGVDMPENVNVVFSAWDNIPENVNSYPIAAVKENEDSIIPENATKCGGDCANCLKCWTVEKGNAVYFDLH